MANFPSNNNPSDIFPDVKLDVEKIAKWQRLISSFYW
jgi:hypothetical protein